MMSAQRNCVEVVQIPSAIRKEFNIEVPVATITEQTLIHVQGERGRKFGVLDILNAFNLETIEYVGQIKDSVLIISRYKSKKVGCVVKDGIVRTIYDVASADLLRWYATGKVMHVTEMFNYPLSEAN